MFELKAIYLTVMLVVEIDQHGLPVIAAGPDLVNYLSVLVEFMHFVEVGLDEVEIQLDLLDLPGLCLEGVDGRKGFSDFGENFFHFLSSHLGLVELNRIEAHC